MNLFTFESELCVLLFARLDNRGKGQRPCAEVSAEQVPVTLQLQQPLTHL
jgi:hypothetical protein